MRTVLAISFVSKQLLKFFENAPLPQAGEFEINDLPGHSVIVNEEAIKANAFKFWECPSMLKPDGSYTNWWRIKCVQ